MTLKSMAVLLVFLSPLAGEGKDTKTLEVHVHAPHWSMEKKIDLAVREMTTLKEEVMKNLPAGMPVAFRLPPGNYLVRARGEGFATAFAGPVELYPHTEKERVTIDLKRGATLKGKVCDEKGAPLEGVRVSLDAGGFIPIFTVNPFLPAPLRNSNTKSSPQLTEATFTDPNGEFILEGISCRSTYQLQIALEKSGFRHLSDRIEVTPGSCLEKEWVLAPGEPSITFLLENENGEPLKDGWICWFDPRVSRTSAGFEEYIGMPCCTGPSRHDGRIVIVNPPPEPLDYWIIARGCQWIEAKASPDEQHAATLERGRGRLEVAVVDGEDGSPVPDAMIHINTLTMFMTPFAITKRGNGAFLIEGDFETFPFYMNLWSYVHGNRCLGFRFAKEEIPGFERFPRRNTAQHGDHIEKYRDAGIEDEARKGKITVELQKALQFTIHVKGVKGIALDGLTAHCLGRQIQMARVVQTSPEEARIIIPRVQPGDTLEVYTSGAPLYEPTVRKTFKVKKDRLEGELKLKPVRNR